MIGYINIRTNPEYKYDEVLGDINYNFSFLSGSTSGNTFITGFTYNNSNAFTILLDNGSNYSAIYNSWVFNISMSIRHLRIK